MSRTPGPWMKGIASAREVYDPHSGHTICRAPVADAFPDVMWEANAPLITAAPELLEAAKKILAINDRMESGELFQYATIKPDYDLLRAAIAKAEEGGSMGIPIGPGLHAAAPDLLASLVEIVDHATKYGAAPFSAVKMFDRARGAIAKAGEEL